MLHVCVCVTPHHATVFLLNEQIPSLVVWKQNDNNSSSSMDHVDPTLFSNFHVSEITANKRIIAQLMREHVMVKYYGNLSIEYDPMWNKLHLSHLLPLASPSAPPVQTIVGDNNIVVGGGTVIGSNNCARWGTSDTREEYHGRTSILTIPVNCLAGLRSIVTYNDASIQIEPDVHLMRSMTARGYEPVRVKTSGTSKVVFMGRRAEVMPRLDIQCTDNSSCSSNTPLHVDELTYTLSGGACISNMVAEEKLSGTASGRARAFLSTLDGTVVDTKETETCTVRIVPHEQSTALPTPAVTASVDDTPEEEATTEVRKRRHPRAASEQPKSKRSASSAAASNKKQ